MGTRIGQHDDTIIFPGLIACQPEFYVQAIVGIFPFHTVIGIKMSLEPARCAAVNIPVFHIEQEECNVIYLVFFVESLLKFISVLPLGCNTACAGGSQLQVEGDIGIRIAGLHAPGTTLLCHIADTSREACHDQHDKRQQPYVSNLLHLHFSYRGEFWSRSPSIMGLYVRPF